jgi:hypothetical protein
MVFKFLQEKEVVELQVKVESLFCTHFISIFSPRSALYMDDDNQVTDHYNNNASPEHD